MNDVFNPAPQVVESLWWWCFGFMFGFGVFLSFFFVFALFFSVFVLFFNFKNYLA